VDVDGGSGVSGMGRRIHNQAAPDYGNGRDLCRRILARWQKACRGRRRGGRPSFRCSNRRATAVAEGGDPVRSVAFSADGSRVLAGVGRGIKMWASVNGEMIRIFSGHTGMVNSVAFSPDGSKILSGSDDGSARVWDAATGTELKSFFLSAPVASVAFSPDGSKLLLAYSI
jgi:WD40 repeat protein